MTCHFCHRAIHNAGFVRYFHWLYHEGCWAKLQSVARVTGGVL